MHIYICIHKCIYIKKHTYTYMIYIHTNIHSFKWISNLNIPILKKHIRYKMWMDKYVNLYLYDSLQFA